MEQVRGIGKRRESLGKEVAAVRSADVDCDELWSRDMRVGGKRRFGEVRGEIPEMGAGS